MCGRGKLELAPESIKVDKWNTVLTGLWVTHQFREGIWESDVIAEAGGDTGLEAFSCLVSFFLPPHYRADLGKQISPLMSFRTTMWFS